MACRICSRSASSASSTLMRDQAARVPGHDLRAALRRAQEVEHHAVLGVLVDLGAHRQAQGQELRDQPPLGALDGAPVLHVVRLAEVREGAVQATGDAVRMRAVGEQHPVAGGRRIAIGAALQRFRPAGRAPDPRLVGRVEGGDAPLVGEVAQLRAAGQAQGVGEEQGDAAPAVVGAGMAGAERLGCFMRRDDPEHVAEAPLRQIVHRNSSALVASCPMVRWRRRRRHPWKHRAGEPTCPFRPFPAPFPLTGRHR